MAPWIDLGTQDVILSGELVAIIDWTRAKESRENREFVSYARAHGFLVEVGDGPKASLVVTKDKVFLLSASAKSIRKKLDRT